MGSQRAGRWIALAVALATAGGVVLAIAVAAQRFAFVAAAIRHPLFFRSGLIVAGCVAVLIGLGLYLSRIGRKAGVEPKPAVASDERGTAMVEFALVLPVAMSVVLILIQSMLLMASAIVVNYAAYAAARTAIVWVPEDLDGSAGYVAEHENEVADETSSQKRHEIRKAAAVACLPAAGRSNATGDPTAGALAAGITEYFYQHKKQTPKWVQTYVSQKMAYAWQFTTATLFAGEDPGVYTPAEDLTVEVRHELLLSVPFADRLFGQEYRRGLGYTTTVTAQHTMSNEGEITTIKEDQFPMR